MRFFSFIFLLLLTQIGLAQITTTPTFPVAQSSVTITFTSSESGLGNYSGDLYAHTGIMISESSGWKHVIGSWGNNLTQPKLTYIGSGKYQLIISPSINAYYGVTATETVKQLAFVFRSADGTKQTADMLIDVYQSSLAISITKPSGQTLFHQNQNITFSALSSQSANLTLKLDETSLGATTNAEISTTTTLTANGWHWLIASAELGGITVYDSAQIFIGAATQLQSRPTGYRQGINYISETETGLVLLAPNKTDVYVLGDFNNWTASSDFQMKKDGEYFWLTLNNLTPQKEYVFQYWIDGKILIGDPFCDKVSDPYDDRYISPAVYPNLIAYPEGKAEGRASVLQTAQTAYQWQTSSWAIPSKVNLLIYELHIRDFTEEGTYQAVIDKLDYLEQLGINAIELMPFNEFEGNSSWGYNPNYYFAPDKAYGTKNDLKELIDSIHNRGMIVIQDLVLNHAYNSSPMVKMYWDDANNRPAVDNPWFNTTSPNTLFSWGSDFNHESDFTKAFADSVAGYWLTEYNVDGFRFDFTKGFTNTPGDGSAYDAPRIAILERMADHIWSVKPNALVILEHFADNAEEKELASHNQGMLIWGNSNYNFNEATMGWNANSDFSWASYQARGFAQPGLVAYMESHDEERLMYKNIAYGNSTTAYDIQQKSTALKRNELAAAFFFSLAGPKMIWQFGELGYDYSIDLNGRTGEKPVRWDYMDDTARQDLFDVYSAMLRLRKTYPVFTNGNETRSFNGATKTLQMARDNHHITLVGNFDVQQQTVNAPFATTGTWHEFFNGQQLNVTAATQSITLAPGEYRLYSNVELPAFHDLATDVTIQENETVQLSVYPNPTAGKINIQSSAEIQQLLLSTIDGKIVCQGQPFKQYTEIDLSNFPTGIYVLLLKTKNNTLRHKIIKTK